MGKGAKKKKHEIILGDLKTRQTQMKGLIERLQVNSRVSDYEKGPGAEPDQILAFNLSSLKREGRGKRKFSEQFLKTWLHTAHELTQEHWFHAMDTAKALVKMWIGSYDVVSDIKGIQEYALDALEVARMIVLNLAVGATYHHHFEVDMEFKQTVEYPTFIGMGMWQNYEFLSALVRFVQTEDWKTVNRFFLIGERSMPRMLNAREWLGVIRARAIVKTAVENGDLQLGNLHIEQVAALLQMFVGKYVLDLDMDKLEYGSDKEACGRYVRDEDLTNNGLTSMGQRIVSVLRTTRKPEF